MSIIDAAPNGPPSCSFTIQMDKWREGGCMRCGLPRLRYARFLCWACFDVTCDDDIEHIVNRYGLLDDPTDEESK